VPIEETMRALVHLQEQGKIRAIGVSNFSRTEIAEAADHGRIDTLQPPYSLFWRHIESEIRPYCVDHDITILAYSPLAQGLLTGRFSLDHDFEPSDPRADLKLFQPEHRERVSRALAALAEIARDKGCTMAQLALSWTIAQPNTCTVTGTRSADQVVENAGAMEVALSPNEIATINEIGREVAEPFCDDSLLWAWQP
jgi:aryl-alcohol dehydrogenase-like predicted oxidoreductase